MRHKESMIPVAAFALVATCLLTVPARGQQPVRRKVNPLVDGKLMYVGRMPHNIDEWIVADLRTWGKYKPTRDAEGVDLVMEAHKPETRIEYEMKHGVPQPKSVRKGHGRKNVMFRIVVTDWVTGRRVWEADILDRGKKNGRRGSTTGSHSEIYARGLSPQLLAEEILRTLRAYVAHLASESGAAAASSPPA